MPCSCRKQIHFITHRLTFTVTAVLLILSYSPIEARLPQQVILVENHCDVLVPWIQTGVRGTIVVNVDAHDDCIPIPPEQIQKLKHLFATGNVAAIGRASNVADSGLYDISNFISVAHSIGVAREAVWAVPLPGYLSKVYTHLPFRTWLIDSLPSLQLKDPVLLTVDADCVDQFASYRCISLVEAVRQIASTLRELPWDVKHLSVSYSESGGYLPVTLRWIGNALQEALEGKDISRPQAPWTSLGKVEEWRRSLLPREIVRRVRTLVLEQPKNPWFHIYLADALFRADSVAGALAEGKKAAHLDPGCCRILPAIGGELAAMGRLDEAEQFLSAAPSVIDAAAEIALAQGLDQTGHTARAIKHYSRISKIAANYSVDLLIGYGYERLGDTTRARQHYQHAVSLLTKPVSEMAGFTDLTSSVTAAERFFRSIGDPASAQILRRDHRLSKFFNK